MAVKLVYMPCLALVFVASTFYALNLEYKKKVTDMVFFAEDLHPLARIKYQSVYLKIKKILLLQVFHRRYLLVLMMQLEKAYVAEHSGRVHSLGIGICPFSIFGSKAIGIR
ncbi:unnamed protein product [Lupinus luteus]|uniref:Uncharacterized protein n=1 Tax=Lupinus luteus TaxID=3873 RepID=A0AAV1Y3R6_LUPLU